MNNPTDPRSPPGALIIGGAHVSIAVARSLGRQGIPVWLMANHPIPRFSRYVQRSFDWPGAEHEAGVSSILDVVREHRLDGWVLIATGDQDMCMIAKHHAELSQHLRVATPDWQTIRWMFDKRLSYERAASLGIDFPKSFKPRDFDELTRMDCRFPVVLKPAYRKGADEFTQSKAWKADDRAALLALYRRAAALVGDEAIILQEWIPGAGEAQFSYAGLWQNGVAVASLVARRTRQHPIDFGRSSTFVETVERPEVEEIAGRFLKSLNYTGVAEIEFKHDRRDGSYKLLDVNGRFWAWCGLGELAGIDFPYLAWRQATGQTVAPCRGKAGVAWMHGSRDIVAAFQEIRRGGTTLGGYLKSLSQPMTFATISRDDPLPGLLEIPVAILNRFAGGLFHATPDGAVRKAARRLRLAK